MGMGSVCLLLHVCKHRHEYEHCQDDEPKSFGDEFDGLDIDSELQVDDRQEICANTT